MRPIIIGLFAAILAAIALPSAAAFAATAPKAPPPPPVNPDARAKGKADAPALIKAANLTCTLADAREIGESVDPKTKVKSVFYEVACKDAGGFVLATHGPGVPPDVATCLEVAASPAACILPADLDPKAQLASLTTRLDPACTVSGAKGVGHATDGSKTVFEVACANGDGFMLETSYPFDPSKPAKLMPCIVYDASTAKCSLTDAAAHAAQMDRVAAAALKDCVVKDRRYMGGDAAGKLYYEFSCQSGKGYIVPQTADFAAGSPIDCETTDQCQLTDVRARQTEQAGLYTKMAKTAGYNCDVDQYALFNVPTPPGHEVVELSCHNRADGAVGVFTASKLESFYDCAHSELEGFRCGITKIDAALATLTADLGKIKDKNSCTVSAARFIGTTADNHGYMEVACADGLPGYTVEYTVKPLAPVQEFPCTGPPPVNDSCRLPGNVKK